jgi:hypothetical protein
MTPPSPTDAERRRFLFDLLPGRSVGAEIGVHQGDFSRVLLDEVAPTVLHLIDPWHHEPSPTYERALYGGRAEEGQAQMDRRHADVLQRFDEEIQRGQVVVHRGQSADVLETFEDESLDWVYIDGNHLYEFVAQDLALSRRKTKVGGLITGDDYREGGWWDGGVKRAVDELTGDPSLRLVILQNGQFVFEKLAG